MRIAHYLRAIRLKDGGVVRAVLDLCLYQARAGQDVMLITYDAEDVPRDWDGQGEEGGRPRLELVEPPGRLRGLEPGFVDRVRPLVDACDVLHVHEVWDPALVAFSRAAREAGKPYILSPHGMLADWSVAQKRAKKAVFYRLYARAVLDGAAFVCTTAQGELDQSQKRHPRTPGRVIPLVFDLDSYRTLPGPEAARAGLGLPETEEPTLLFLSRLHYKKRPELLIEAGARLKEMGEKFRIVFAGPGEAGYVERLRELAAGAGIGDSVRFVGMVTDLKASLIRACDVLVLPSSLENFGIVFFEALACGTPVVATKGTDTWRELESSGGARIVDIGRGGGVCPGDGAALAGALAGMVRDRAGMRAMGEAGRRWVLGNMEPMDIAGRYVALYREAAGKAGRP